MTTVLEKYQELIQGGDPYVRELYLAKSIKSMVTIVTTYVLFVTLIGPALMRHRKPFQMTKLIILYNFALVVYYVYFLLKGAYFVYNRGFSIFCDNHLDSTNNPFIASVFMVLTKKFKKITKLHVFHHALVPVLGWFYLRAEKGTYLAAPMGINCFVHVIMYAYYTVAALGPEYRKYLWWKKYLTGLQIMQFAVITIYLLTMYAIGCMTSKLIILVSVVLAILFFFLFVDYYKSTFKQNSKENKKNIHQNGSILKESEKSQ